MNRLALALVLLLAGCAAQPTSMDLNVKLDADVKALLAQVPLTGGGIGRVGSGTGGGLIQPIGGFGDSEPAGGGISTGDDATLGTLSLGAGTVSSPSIQWTLDDDGSGTGIYRPSANQIGFVTNGVTAALFTAAGILNLSTSLDLVSASTIDWNEDLFLRRSAASTLTVDSDGAGGAATLVVSNDVYVGSNLRHDGDLDTLVGFSTDQVTLRAGAIDMLTLTESTTDVATFGAQATWATGLGTITHLLGPSDQAFQIRAAASQSLILGANNAAYTLTVNTSGYVASTAPFRAPDGSASAPAYSFSSATDSGLYYVSGAVAVADGGTLSQAWNGGSTTFYGTANHGGNATYGLKRFVEASTAVAASPNSLNTGADNWFVFTNEGSTAENHHNLPTASAGLTYTFVVQDSDGIQINVATGDSIRIAGSTCTTGTGNVESATVGDTITLVAINATEWVAVHYVGTWTLN